MRGIITFLTFCTALAALAQVPCKWTVDLARVTPADWDCLRGETVELMPSFVSGRDVRDLSGVESATLWWQTNGMGAAYWSAPASVDTNSRPHRLVARWTPEMDCGAAAYRYFVGAAAPSGTQYRAHGTIRMRGAPGFSPNELPLPVPFIDFAKVAVTNAPWSAASDLTTNDVRAIALTRDEAEAGFTEWVCDPATITATVWGTPMPGHPPGPGHDVTISFSVVRSKMDGLADYWEMHGSSFCHAIPTLYDPDGTATNFSAEMKLSSSGVGVSPSSITVTATRTRLRPTPEMEAAWDAKASAADLAAATNGLASAEEVAAARLESSLVYQLLVGSNVVAEVTNYNSTVRSPQLRLLQLEEGQYKVVWAETNGLSRTLQDANRHADDAVAELASRKADRAWGKYTSGMGAEAPSNTTWVSTPVVVIAGGYEYAKVITSAGEAWVLCSNGLNAGPDTNAYFRVATLDGESLFSVERSESVLIGVRAGGITCSGNTVSIPLDVVSAEAPVCYACDDLVSQNWVNLAESLPSWVTSASVSGSAGSWVWTIETAATKGFFQFRALQEGRTVIRNNAPAELSQGIWVNGSRYVPVANGSTLTWTLAQ